MRCWFFIMAEKVKVEFGCIGLNNLNINKSNTKKPKSEHNHLSLQSEISLNKNNF